MKSRDENLVQLAKMGINKSYLVYQSILRELLRFLVAAPVELGCGKDMRQGSETMEQHGSKLDHQDQREEEHEHQTDRFQLEILFRDVHLDGWFESRVD